MSRPHSSIDEPLCRACSSFQEYFKQSKTKYKDDANQVKHVTEELLIDVHNCPLDRNILGNYTWSFLHTMAANYPEKPNANQQKDMKQFFSLFTKFYPCRYCASDFKKDITKMPPRTESQEKLSQWLCFQHNLVNKKLGKNEFDCSKVNERWRDGWQDGSCG